MQDNYTLAQPGIQTKVIKLKDIMKRIDSESCVMGGVYYKPHPLQVNSTVTWRGTPLITCSLRFVG